MLKRIFKISIISLVIFLSLIMINATKAIDLSAESEEYERVVLNGEPVTYLYTTTPVLMPTNYQTLSNEMRGAWVTTVWNEDMAKQVGTSEESINEWKAQFISVLDTLEKFNMNTVFFQVRPCNDAFYQSDYNDWSKFLYKEGKDPGWNPLPWMIEETHKRNMQFQCWMNAFRVTEEEQFSDNAINHTDQELITAKQNVIKRLTSGNFAKQHPECVLLGDYDSKLILNPGDLLVHEHLLNTIEELIRKYDIDGFHFDDYFYLSGRSQDQYNPQLYNVNFAGGVSYKELFTGENMMNDIPTYLDYQQDNVKYDLEEGLTLGEFRRSSLNNLFKKIRLLVDDLNSELNRHVEFGSKPAAVWQSNSEKCNDSPSSSPLGSNTHCGAYNSNYNLFADTKYWVEHGYIDWIAPQVYFDFQSKEVPYADIVKWWANIVTNTNRERTEQGLKPIKMYVAHGIYKYSSTDKEYTDSNESVYQLRYNKNFDCIVGDAYYAFSDLKVMKTEIQKRAINNVLYLFYRNHPTLPINLDPLDTDELEVTSAILREGSKENYAYISFDKVEGASMYIIHRVPVAEDTGNIDYTETKYRIAIVKDNKFENEVRYETYISDQFNYYVQPVSQNYYASKYLQKVDASQIIQNSAPTAINITFDNNKLGVSDTLAIHIPYAHDVDNDTLSYEVKISLDGLNGPFLYDVDTLEYLDSEIFATFKGFGSDIEEVIVRVIVSDGPHKVTNYSEPASFGDATHVDPVTPVPSKDPASGCSFGMIGAVFSTTMFFTLMYLAFKKKK